MKPVLRFVPSKLMVKGQCIYRTNDLMLVYEASAPSLENPEPTVLADVIDHQFRLDRPSGFLLIADTLTLAFSGRDRHLFSLDAYTNRQLWQVSSLNNVPETSGRCLLLAEQTSSEEDRYSLNVIPKYEIALSQQWIRIILDRENADSYYEVASNLVVGLKMETITDIYLLDVAFL